MNWVNFFTLEFFQVVTWSIYTYFMAALMGAQWVKPEHPEDFETTYKLPSFSSFSTNGTNAGVNVIKLFTAVIYKCS